MTGSGNGRKAFGQQVVAQIKDLKLCDICGNTRIVFKGLAKIAEWRLIFVINGAK